MNVVYLPWELPANQTLKKRRFLTTSLFRLCFVLVSQCRVGAIKLNLAVLCPFRSTPNRWHWKITSEQVTCIICHCNFTPTFDDATFINIHNDRAPDRYVMTFFILFRVPALGALRGPPLFVLFTPWETFPPSPLRSVGVNSTELCPMEFSSINNWCAKNIIFFVYKVFVWIFIKFTENTVFYFVLNLIFNLYVLIGFSWDI